jgi:hypothetical protein
MSTLIPRQVIGPLSYEGREANNINARLVALEGSLPSVASSNKFYLKHFGIPSGKLQAHIRNIQSRIVALEASSTAKVDFDLKLPRRTPWGKFLFDCHNRCVLLGG